MTLGPLAYPAVHLARNQRRWSLRAGPVAVLLASSFISWRSSVVLFTGLPFNAMKTCRGEEHVRRTYSIMAEKTESRTGALAFPWWVVLPAALGPSSTPSACAMCELRHQRCSRWSINRRIGVCR